jgi:hypothetical protein
MKPNLDLLFKMNIDEDSVGGIARESLQQFCESIWCLLERIDVAEAQDRKAKEVLLNELDTVLERFSDLKMWLVFYAIDDGYQSGAKAAPRIKAHEMRERRRPLIDARRKRLHLAVRSVVGNVALVNSDKFAESILDGVRDHLKCGPSDPWPSKSTVRRAVCELIAAAKATDLPPF